MPEALIPAHPDDKLLKDWDRKEWRDAEPRMAAIFAAFLARAERR